jgi:hypothetical protein
MPTDPLPALASNARLAGGIGFWWGFAEGTFFFIVPDVYISFATLFSLRAGAIAWLASIAGSVLAMVLVQVVILGLGWDYLAFLHWIPGISGRLLHQVGQSLTSEGLPYTPFLARGGVPLKVYGGVAFSLGFSARSVLLWTVFARVVRIAPTFAGVVAIRSVFPRWADAHPRLAVALLGLFWTAFYSYYFVHMGRR